MKLPIKDCLCATVILALTVPAALGQASAIPQTNRARMIIRLPPRAELLIEGKQTRRSMAEVRTFDSPPLDPNENYSYTLRATWPDGSGEATTERTVNIKAGDTITVDLRPSSSATVKNAPDSAPQPQAAARMSASAEKKAIPVIANKAEPKDEKSPANAALAQKSGTTDQKEPRTTSTPPADRKSKVVASAKPDVSSPPPIVEKKPTPTLKVAKPQDVSLTVGSEASFTVQISHAQVAQPIRVRIEGLPTGVTAEPAVVTPGSKDEMGQVRFSLKAVERAEPGDTVVRVVAESEKADAESSFRLKVLPPLRPSRIALKAPDLIEVLPGASAKLPIRVARIEYDGPITVQLDGIPGREHPLEVVVRSGSEMTEVEVPTQKHATAGNYVLRMQARGGELKAQTRVTLTVKATPAPPLKVFAPGSLTVQIGGFAIALPVKIVRGDTAVPVTIRFEGVPESVLIKEASVPAGQNLTYVETAVTSNAEEGEKEIKLIATCGSDRVEQTLKLHVTKR